jgi:hypothetical protein
MSSSTNHIRWRWSKLRGPGADLRQLRSPIQVPQALTGAEGPHGRIYSSRRWKALRTELVSAHPYCARCSKRGGRLYCDHRVELKDGGAPFERSNIEALFAPCHTLKTNAVKREQGESSFGGL